MIRVVWWQMAGGSRVLSPGEGTGDSSCYGFGGFLRLFAEETGKSQSASECPGLSFAGARCPTQLEQVAEFRGPARQLDPVFTPTLSVKGSVGSGAKCSCCPVGDSRLLSRAGWCLCPYLCLCFPSTSTLLVSTGCGRLVACSWSS